MDDIRKQKKILSNGIHLYKICSRVSVNYNLKEIITLNKIKVRRLQGDSLANKTVALPDLYLNIQVPN